MKPATQMTNFKQYSKLLDSADRMRSAVDEGELSEVGSAFSNHQWIFVYMSTDNHALELDERGQRLLMGRKDAKAFFTIIWDLYEVARSGSSI